MMKKLAKVGYRVAPMYNDEPQGTIVEELDGIFVIVEWDTGKREELMIKWLRKGNPK